MKALKPGHQHPAARLSAALLVLHAGRPHGVLRGRRAAIYAPDARDDRSVGGTPSNDPRLTDEYLGRVKAMYHRSRNHTSIIGFALGRDSGNGYNMYKAYQWLKSVRTVETRLLRRRRRGVEQRRHSSSECNDIELLGSSEKPTRRRSMRSWNSTCAA